MNLIEKPKPGDRTAISLRGPAVARLRLLKEKHGVVINFVMERALTEYLERHYPDILNESAA